jgi:heme A synthase
MKKIKTVNVFAVISLIFGSASVILPIILLDIRDSESASFIPAVIACFIVGALSVILGSITVRKTNYKACSIIAIILGALSFLLIVFLYLIMTFATGLRKIG